MIGASTVAVDRTEAPSGADWPKVQFGELTLRHKQGFYTKAPYRPRGTRLVRITDLHGSRIDYDSMPRLDLDDVTVAQFRVDDGDFLFARSGAIGRYGLVNNPPEAVFGSYIIRFVFDSGKANREFIGYAYQSHSTQAQIDAIIQGSSNKNVNAENIKALKIPLPRLEEQGAIAQALSDADALIESLEQLIKKKRRIKQGAMQELLTGKRRLPGFGGEWVRRTLGQLGTFLKGQGVSRALSQSGNLPCVRYGEIYTVHTDVIRSFTSWISTEVASGATALHRGDILFAGSGETKEEIGKAAAFVGSGPAFAGGDIVILRAKDVDATFVGYGVNQPYVVRQKVSRGQGDAVVHISARALSEVEFDLPLMIQEQAAVAKLLEDMEAELRFLQSRVHKARQIKEGMMQELLTGRIRLI